MNLHYVHPYLPNTAPENKRAMLDAIGVAEINEFYADVPDALRFEGRLNLPEALPAEQDLVRHMGGIIEKNHSTDERLSFLGYGCYRHGVPAVVDEVITRSEFLTAYAGEPFEDHGRFHALFEYTSMMAELLQMDVVNVPTYDGYQATATALAMAGRITNRKRIVLVSDAHHAKFDKVVNYLRSLHTIDIVATSNGTADLEGLAKQLGDDVAAVWIETPSVTGAVEQQVEAIAQLAHGAGALVVVGTDPLMYGLVEAPAVQGADIVSGDIQSLGLHQWGGGARGGFIAVHDDPTFVLELPSRLFGLTSTDVEGEYGFGDVAWDRTSFALREEGKEWVGTAAALWGIAAGVYMALMGPQGMRDIGETIVARTRYAQQQLAAVESVTLGDDALHFREFTIELSGMTAQQLVDDLRAQGIEPGVVLSDSTLLVCVTELSTQQDIDHLVAAVSGALTNAEEK